MSCGFSVISGQWSVKKILDNVVQTKTEDQETLSHTFFANCQLLITHRQITDNRKLKTQIMRLTLIRHAMTDWNATGRWQGHSDTPINALGERQALLLRKRLEHCPFDAIYSSPLQRARRTLELASPGSKPVFDDRLKEIDFGEFEARTYAENVTHPQFSSWLSNPLKVPTPGGESLEGVVTRMMEWLEGLPPDRESEKHYLAVSHSCAIRALISHLMNLKMVVNKGHHFPFVISTPHTSLSRLRKVGDLWTLEQLGDVGHLEMD